MNSKEPEQKPIGLITGRPYAGTLTALFLAQGANAIVGISLMQQLGKIYGDNSEMVADTSIWLALLMLALQAGMAVTLGFRHHAERAAAREGQAGGTEERS